MLVLNIKPKSISYPCKNVYLMYLDKYIDQKEIYVISVFGSVLTDKSVNTSDIDLLVDIKHTDPIKYAENYFSLKFNLQDLLHIQIDLVEEQSLKNKYLLENINQSKQLLYAS